MVSRIKSVFKSDKPVEHIAFPKPPNRRQMTEDIEQLTGDDALMLFVDLLQNRAASTGEGNTAPTFSSTFATRLDDLSNSRLSDSSVPDSPSSELAEAALKDARTKISPTSPHSVHKSPISIGTTTETTNSETSHLKIKQMTVACHKTLELVSYLESKLKDLEKDFSEFTTQMETFVEDQQEEEEGDDDSDILT